MLLAIDVGNTQTVFGLFDGERLTEQFRVGTDRAHTADELAVMLRALRRARGARRDRALVDGAAARSASTRRFAERWAGAELLVLGPGSHDGRSDPLRRPARGRPRPDRERGRGARAPRRAGDRRRLRDVDELRRRLGGGRVRRRGARARDRDLDGRAVRARRAAAEGAVRRAGARDRQDDDRRRSSRASSTASRARSTRSSTGSARSSARRSTSDRDRRAGGADRAALADDHARSTRS